MQFGRVFLLQLKTSDMSFHAGFHMFLQGVMGASEKIRFQSVKMYS